MPFTKAAGDWHLDKKVSLSLILAILVNTGTVAWWASGMQTRVENLAQDANKRIATLETDMRETVTNNRLIGIQLATLSERMTAQSDTLHRIEVILDRKADRKQ
jgi:hypothetical protein